MPAIWAWLMANIIMPFVTYELPVVETSIANWAKGLYAAYKQKQVDAVNVQAEQKAVASGDPDAIAKAGESVLNGTTPPNP